MFSLDEIEDILASILDLATIERNEIICYVVSLPYIKPVALGPALYAMMGWRLGPRPVGGMQLPRPR